MGVTTKRRDLLSRVRQIALALPDTEESTRLGGSPHFYVRGKIFAGCAEGPAASLGVKVGLELQVRDHIGRSHGPDIALVSEPLLGRQRPVGALRELHDRGVILLERVGREGRY